jgi:hypothetical protein
VLNRKLKSTCCPNVWDYLSLFGLSLILIVLNTLNVGKYDTVYSLAQTDFSSPKFVYSVSPKFVSIRSAQNLCLFGQPKMCVYSVSPKYACVYSVSPKCASILSAQNVPLFCQPKMCVSSVSPKCASILSAQNDTSMSKC